MIPKCRVAAWFLLLALVACGEQPHPIEQQLSALRPVTVAPLKGLGWPAGTLLCPLGIYESRLSDSAPVAGRVNAFLARKEVVGDEGQWMMVVVKPGTMGDDGLERLIFKRGKYQVITSEAELRKRAESLPAGFTPRVCLPVESARVLATRARSSTDILISFGTD